MRNHFVEVSDLGYFYLDDDGNMVWYSYRTGGYYSAEFAVLEAGISMKAVDRALEMLKQLKLENEQK